MGKLYDRNGKELGKITNGCIYDRGGMEMGKIANGYIHDRGGMELGRYEGDINEAAVVTYIFLLMQ